METIIPKVVIERVKLPTETLGSLYVDKTLQAKTMELPWRENAHNTSCIPNGLYKVVKEAYTEKHPYPHFRVLGVPDRAGILWHKITYVKDLLGCTGIGGAFVDLNKDSVPDIIDSGKTLQKLYDMLPAEFWVLYKDRD